MMRDTTDKKRAAVICAAVVIGFLGLYLALLIGPVLMESYGIWAATGLLTLCAAVIVAVIAGILVALGQRLREIEDGEEEDAKKY